MPAKPRPNIFEKLHRAVRNDPGKAGFLTLLVVILAVLQVRLATKRQGPDQALADSAIPSNNGSLLNPSGVAPKPSAIATLRGWAEAPAMPIGRNLFAVEIYQFPQDFNRPTPTAATGNSGFWDDLAKSMSSRADVRKERQFLIENLQQQAAQMRLQSTVMGVKPKAVIDGALVGEGDVVAQFRVLKIEPRRIIVEREGIRLEIPMK